MDQEVLPTRLSISRRCETCNLVYGILAIVSRPSLMLLAKKKMLKCLPPDGIEPAASPLLGERNSQLCYRGFSLVIDLEI